MPLQQVGVEQVDDLLDARAAQGVEDLQLVADAATSSSGVRRGVKINATLTSSGSCARRLRQSRGLPVPISPVSCTKPPALATP